MSDFEITIKQEHDGTRECNRHPDIEDEQCSLCLVSIIWDWYIVKSFKRHKQTKLAVCLDCIRNA